MELGQGGCATTCCRQSALAMPSPIWPKCRRRRCHSLSIPTRASTCLCCSTQLAWSRPGRERPGHSWSADASIGDWWRRQVKAVSARPFLLVHDTAAAIAFVAQARGDDLRQSAPFQRLVAWAAPRSSGAEYSVLCCAPSLCQRRATFFRQQYRRGCSHFCWANTAPRSWNRLLTRFASPTGCPVHAVFWPPPSKGATTTRLPSLSRTLLPKPRRRGRPLRPCWHSGCCVVHPRCCRPRFRVRHARAHHAKRAGVLAVWRATSLRPRITRSPRSVHTRHGPSANLLLHGPREAGTVGREALLQRSRDVQEAGSNKKRIPFYNTAKQWKTLQKLALTSVDPSNTKFSFPSLASFTAFLEQHTLFQGCSKASLAHLCLLRVHQGANRT